MSDVANCPTCGAACQIVGTDRDGAPQLQALRDTDAQNKIEQLKQSLIQMRATVQTERANTKTNTAEIEQLKTALHDDRELLRSERAAAQTKISNLEAELSNLRSSKGVPVSGEKLSP